MAGKMKTVKWNRTHVIDTKKSHSGESSPYWNFITNHPNGNRDKSPNDHTGMFIEPIEGNPDSIAEPIGDEENITRRLIRENWKEIKFSKKEQEILILLSQGMTPEDAAKKLGISRRRIRGAVARIQKKGLKWYGAKMAHDSIYREEEDL